MNDKTYIWSQEVNKEWRVVALPVVPDSPTGPFKPDDPFVPGPPEAMD